MNVLYGVNTNGQGHINRSRIFIDLLRQDGHSVDVLYSGPKVPSYVEDFEPYSYHVYGPHEVYSANKIDLFRSIISNVFSYSTYKDNFAKLVHLTERKKYDVIFSDFEVYTHTLGKKVGLPVISIDHQHSLFHKDAVSIPHSNIDKFSLKFVKKSVSAHFDRAYGIDYTCSIKYNNNTFLIPLVWKPEFKNVEVISGEFFLAYLANRNFGEIVKVFSSFPQEQFVIYGFDVDKKIENIIFKKTNRKKFIEDIARCKGVIGNSGFNLTWEACILNKNIWTIPFPSQFEQKTNAYRLKKINRAFVTEKFNAKNLSKFIEYTQENKGLPSIKLPIISGELILLDIYAYLETKDEHDTQNRFSSPPTYSIFKDNAKFFLNTRNIKIP